uniref:Ribonuclease H1 n=1 Tax=Lygus hesperus TaxID=30085 RepID=A0A0A9WJ85_LYGHE
MDRVKRGNKWGRNKPVNLQVITFQNVTAHYEGILADISSRQLSGAADGQPLMTAQRYLNLLYPGNKDDLLPMEMRDIALETLDTRFPSHRWLHVFTDGSATGARRRNAGAGVYCKEFEICCPVGHLASNFEGEIKGILMALERIKKRVDPNVAILVDSQAAIMAVTSSSQTISKDVLDCRKLVHEGIMDGKVIVFQWVPSHCGIDGNERADELAKRGAEMNQPGAPKRFGAPRRIVRIRP